MWAWSAQESEGQEHWHFCSEIEPCVSQLWMETRNSERRAVKTKRVGSVPSFMCTNYLKMRKSETASLTVCLFLCSQSFLAWVSYLTVDMWGWIVIADGCSAWGVRAQVLNGIKQMDVHSWCSKLCSVLLQYSLCFRDSCTLFLLSGDLASPGTYPPLPVQNLAEITSLQFVTAAKSTV